MIKPIASIRFGQGLLIVFLCALLVFLAGLLILPSAVGRGGR